MASLNYYDSTNKDYEKLIADGRDGKTPYINPDDKHWYIDEQDTGYKAETDFVVSETNTTILFDIDGNKTNVRKSVDQILGLDIITLSNGDGVLSDDYSNYDYLVVYHKNNNGDVTHTTIMFEENNPERKYQLLSANNNGTINVASLIFNTYLSYSLVGSGITVYRIDGVRTADESTALEIANNILGVRTV